MESGNTLGYSYYMPKGGLTRLKSIIPLKCCDLFGVFDRYLAPAYHHDRCERSVQMKLYSMHKREFVIIFLGFFVALGLAVFIGLVGPPITWSTEIHASYLDNVTDMSTGPFVLKSPQLTTYNQQLWLISKLEIESRDDECHFICRLNLSKIVSCSIFLTLFLMRRRLFEKTFGISLDLYGISTGTVVKILNTSNKRSRHLKCKGECEPFTVLHLGFIDFAKYFIVVRFSDLKGVHERYHIKDVDFYFKTYNPNFTQMEMSFRFIYSTACFGITKIDWSIEQNGYPLFPLMFLVNSTLLGMMDAIFQVSFMSTLLIFWLSIYHGLRQVERRFLTFYLPKFVLVGSLWVSAMILATWQKLNTTKDPTYSYEVETEKFEKLKNFFSVCGICYLVYLTYLILKAYSELRSMPYFDLRLKFLTGLMLIVIKLTIAITYMRFGMDILEDHFVADLSTKYSSSAEFMCFYGLLNFYVFTMVFVYSPASSTVLNNSSQITKDNPQFSMIDDSDDEVIYGSDEDEDTKTPLNSNAHSHSTNNHHDDSD
ncbi:Transmembrane protein [Orchesella cincta]|uniref:Transmembrane protein n=1 Tax=Orchesella cincta TaxID=48709 RepID=A0A1D2MB18_ORCCI|nr:Transmembrane protein [Orchesella cincta]